MKRRIISILMSIFMMFSVLVSFSIPTMAAGSTYINFDNLTSFAEKSDFITGGGLNPAGISISSDFDHTGKGGKSLKVSGRSSRVHRLKFVNSVTSQMLQKTVTATVWARTSIDTKLAIGAYGDAGQKFATEPIAKDTFDVKANTWTLLTLSFNHKDAVITQISVSQDYCDSEPIAETFYLDDLFVGTDGQKPPVGGETVKTENTNPTVTSSNEFKLDFDGLTMFAEKVDFITGGGLDPVGVSISSDFDHADKGGKSLKVSGRSSGVHRLKFVNSITSQMSQKTVTATVWARTNIDTKLAVGAYSDTGLEFATEPVAKDTFDVKANTWTLLTLTFKHKNPIITQFTVSQDNCGDAPIAETIYLDDLLVTTNGSPTTEEVVEGTKTISFQNFDTAKSIDELDVEGGGGVTLLDFSLTNDECYGGEGQSLAFLGRLNTYSRIKFNTAFDNLSQAAGTKYNISCMVKVPDNARMEKSQFRIGIITFLGAVGNGKEYYYDNNYNYTVNRGEWTKVELPYTNTGDKVYGIVLEQSGMSSDIPYYEYIVPDIYIDDVTVEVTNKEIPKQKILSVVELRELAGLGVDVYINDERLTFGTDTRPTVVEGRTLIPLRRIFESLDCAVYWNNDTNTVTGKKGTKEISLTIGDKTAYVDNKPVELDVPAQLINDRTLVPARFIAESLGCIVDWDEANQKVIIKDETKENSIYIYKDLLKQEIYGFGTAANHNAWYLQRASSEMQEKTLKALYDVEEGIGLNIVRLEVNPFTPKDKSNFSNEFQYTICPEKDVWDLDADKHQIWYAQESLKYEKDMIFFATPWSAPSWMKINNSVAGTTQLPNGLKKENYEYYAKYLATWAKHYKDTLGLDLRWMSIQNEPEIDTPYASSVYNMNDLYSLTKLVTEKFKEEGISTLVGGPELSNQYRTNSFMHQWENLDGDFINNDFQVLMTHSYGYKNGTLELTNLDRYNVPLIQTETCYGAGTPRVYTNDVLLRCGNELVDHFNHNYNAWCYWYGIREVDSLGKQNSESLIDFVDKEGEMAFAREYYAVGHFSKFIRPGYRVVSSNSYNPDVVVTTAINPETGKLVLVVVNNSNIDETIAINGLTAASASVYRSGEGEDLKKLDDVSIANGVSNVTFKAQTMTTIVEN